MDPFVKRLIQRLNDPSRPLSRNRHFHTFDTPEGRAALRTSRRLRNLQRDILASVKAGIPAKVSFHVDQEDQHRIELRFDGIRGKRTSLLRPEEYELLQELDGVRQALTAKTQR